MDKAVKAIGAVGLFLLGAAALVTTLSPRIYIPPEPSRGGPDVNIANVPNLSHYELCKTKAKTRLWRRENKLMPSDYGAPAMTLYVVPPGTTVAAPRASDVVKGKPISERQLAVVQVAGGAGFDEWIVDLRDLTCVESVRAEATEKVVEVKKWPQRR